MLSLRKRSLQDRIGLVLQTILAIGVGAAVWERQWPTAILTLAIMGVTLLPLLLQRFIHLYIPRELEVLAIAFVFASLFLGEVRSYYTRFWWWDIVLHTSSGFLLGIAGFLLVHVLNERKNVSVHMTRGFVAFFAFLFAVGMGAQWEIFEFSMDRLLGWNMQKPMLGDPSGLTDTMFDLVVDTLGALLISLAGYHWLKTPEELSFLERWIHRFVDANPRLFRRDRG